MKTTYVIPVRFRFNKLLSVFAVEKWWDDLAVLETYPTIHTRLHVRRRAADDLWFGRK